LRKDHTKEVTRDKEERNKDGKGAENKYDTGTTARFNKGKKST